LVTLDDTNKVGSKTTHELLLAATDELWVNGVKVTGNVQIVVKRAATPALSALEIPTTTSQKASTTAPQMAPPTAATKKTKPLAVVK
jgi:hypothetical protein